MFDCAIGDRAIHYMGHVKMMGAVQPFISGAISKTVNLPERTTVDEVAQLFVESWQLGVKAIAIYRDNCKVAQPLSRRRTAAAQSCCRSARPACVGASAAAAPAGRPHRGRPQVQGRRVRGLHPRRPVRGRDARRHLRGHREGGHDPRRPDELVHDLGLARPPVRRAARGVRLEVQPHALRAERASRTTPDIRVAKSIVDYIFRWMGKKFLTADQQEEAGILTPEVKARLAAAYTGTGRRHRRCGSRGGSSGPDGALQPVGGRGRVRPLRRPHGQDGLVLHVPRLRHQHRLQLSQQLMNATQESRGDAALSLSSATETRRRGTGGSPGAGVGDVA